MEKRKRAASAAVLPVHNAHLVLLSALELHMAPMKFSCVAACTKQLLYSPNSHKSRVRTGELPLLGVSDASPANRSGTDLSPIRQQISLEACRKSSTVTQKCALWQRELLQRLQRAVQRDCRLAMRQNAAVLHAVTISSSLQRVAQSPGPKMRDSLLLLPCPLANILCWVMMMYICGSHTPRENEPERAALEVWSKWLALHFAFSLATKRV